MIEVEAPDGSVVEFPDGTSPDTIKQAMSKRFGRQTTGLGALAAGASQGVTFGFGDEIAASAGALYDAATGQGNLADSYNRRVTEQRNYLSAAARENPGWYYTGEIGSAVALPFTAPGRLAARGAAAAAQRVVGRPGLARTMTQGAIEGAGYGAAYGAGKSEGDIQARAEGAVGGGVTGAAFGAAAPAVIQGVTSGARSAYRSAQNIMNPEAAATRAVGQAMQDVGPMNLSDELMRVDANETTRGLARRASNISPQARETLNDAINPRFETQSGRIGSFLRQQNPALTGDNAAARDTLRQQAQSANRPAYQRAFAQGDRPLNSPTLERLMSSPEMRKAMQEAVPEYQNRAVLDGYQGFNARVSVTDDGQVVFRRGAEGPPAYPNLAYWDTVKRTLDRQAEMNLRQTGSRGTAGQMARQLREELDSLVPSYNATRSQAMRFFQAEDAVEAGENFARGGIRADFRQMMRAKQAMTPAERRLFEQSFSNELLKQVEEVKDRSNIAGQFASSPAKRQRLRVGMGTRRAREFETQLYIEGIMDRARTAVQGNSTTARQLQELGFTGTAIGGGALLSGGDFTSWTAWAPLFLRYGGRQISQTQAERWARQVADLLTRRDNPQALERAMQRLAQNDRLMEGFRNVLTRMAPAATGQAAGGSGAQTEPLRVEVTRGDVQSNNPNALMR